jgi:hypothetical protein
MLPNYGKMEWSRRKRISIISVATHPHTKGWLSIAYMGIPVLPMYAAPYYERELLQIAAFIHTLSGGRSDKHK